MTIYSVHFSTRITPQQEQALPTQVKNSEGGYVFKLDCWKRLDRWLILGAEGGTYYASEKELTKDNAQTILECLNMDGVRTVETIVSVSVEGRAPKNAPAIFALAMATGHNDVPTRRAALAALPAVCRTGTDLFAFVQTVKNFRGWGRGLRKAVAQWYQGKPYDKLAYQVLKYQNRNGWSHRDVLRLAGGELKEQSPRHAAIYRWVVDGFNGFGDQPRFVEIKKGTECIRRGYTPISSELLPSQIMAYEQIKNVKSEREAIALIRDYKLTHEMVPNQFKNSPEVWEALLEDMPLTALMRNLGKMSNVGLLKPLSSAVASVVSKLTDVERIRKARIHPLAALVASVTYSRGHGVKGSLRWDVVTQVDEALQELFYTAFKTIEPTHRKILIGLDVSGSMSLGEVGGMTGITPMMAAATMCMVTARSETQYQIMAFSHAFVPFPLSKNDSTRDVLKKTTELPFGGTDCSLPMVWATERKIEVDAFLVYTDSETHHGHLHPYQALEQYRQKMGRPAKLIVVGMTATGFSIANPEDAGMLDVVGFDTAAPKVMADFIRS